MLLCASGARGDHRRNNGGRPGRPAAVGRRSNHTCVGLRGHTADFESTFDPGLL